MATRNMTKNQVMSLRGDRSVDGYMLYAVADAIIISRGKWPCLLWRDYGELLYFFVA